MDGRKRAVATILAMTCMLVPMVWSCDHLAAGTCTGDRDSCRFPNGTTVNDNACAECWPTYFTCIKTADCEDNSFYGSTAITTCRSTDNCNSTVCAFPSDSASAALLPHHVLGAVLRDVASFQLW